MEPHDYAAAAAFAQQQQQQQAAGVPPPHFPGYHHQQFPQHPSSFIPSHHLPQQQPFHPLHHQQQKQQQQLQHHPSLQFPFHRPPLQAQHSHLLPPQQPFPPHLPPPHHLTHHANIPHPLFNPFEPPPPPLPPPADPELHKRIDKLIEYTAKNGPEFEAMIREKQKENPEYAFLLGGEGAGYYHHRLWLCTHALNNPPSSFPQMPPLNPANFNAPSMMGGPPMHHSPFVGGGFYDQPQQQQQAYMIGGHGRPEFEPKTFKGLAGPLPSDVAAGLSNVLDSLSGTKESIKGTKIWFMQRSPFAPALAEALRDRVLALDDSERQLHIIYLANDILFDSLQRRVVPRELDNEALAFRPVLGSMLARIYHNPHNRESNQSRLQKILQFWASKEVYDNDTIYAFEGEMLGGTPTSTHAGPLKEQVSAPNDSPNPSGLSQSHWQSEQQRSSVPPRMEQKDQAGLTAASVTSNSQFVPPVATQFSANALPSAYPSVAGTATEFGGPLPLAGSVPNQAAHLQKITGKVGDQSLPPYPLFPPGLIPGMVRKMQIGSGVPYSPMSPLDIPTMIPPSTVSQSYILERVSKFFKEIGEVNPSEGPLKGSRQSNEDSDDEYEQEAPVRKGGACIPPPPNLQVVDPETGTLPDGSVERKPGSLGSGRLGLGATANPNEVTQYDDVYTSYRKQRSTDYHSSMSVRAAAR